MRSEKAENMRIQCPSCAATYEVAAGLLDQPRTVRCAQCSHDWMATAMPKLAAAAVHAHADDPVPHASEALAPLESTASAAKSAAEGDLAFDDDPPPHPTPPSPEADQHADAPPLSAIERLSADEDPAKTQAGSGRGARYLMIAWAASFVMLVTLGALTFAKRQQVMEFWPASQRAYAVFGLAPTLGAPEPQRH